MSPGFGPGWLLLLAALAGGSAHAAPGDPGAEEAPSTPALPEELPLDDAPAVPTLDALVPAYSEAWAWRRASPPGGVGVRDAAVHPFDANRLAAVTADDTLWVSRDGGRTWTAALGADEVGARLSEDESILLGVQARLDEVVDADLDGEIDQDDLAGLLDDAVSAAADETRADLEIDPDFTAARGERRAGSASVAWVGAGLYASIGDVTWLSRDAGRSWGEVLDVASNDVVELPSGAVVALTADGARVSLDGRSFYDFVDGTEGRSLGSGVVAAGVLLVTSADGLWASRDGQSWGRWGELRGEVRAVVAHPERPDAVWVLSSAGLLRSRDGGLSFGDAVLRDAELSSVLSPLPDRVVVARPGSVLESLDDGETWSVATQGLEGVAEARLAFGPDSGLLLATADGLWTLRRLSTPAEGAQAQAWADLSDLLRASLAREGVELGFDPFKRRWSSAVVPRLQVEAMSTGLGGRDWDPLGTTADRGGSWRVMGRLVWTPRGSRSVDDSSYGLDLDAAVLVVDDVPILMTGDDDYVAAARLGQAALGYRASLADAVSELYRARAELVSERPRLRSERLQRQVFHELSIAEVEARLDALTDGAVLRWESARTLESQEL